MVRIFFSFLVGSQLCSLVYASTLTEKLTQQLLSRKKAFVYSPVSVEVALSMTAEGADKETRKQFEKLGLPNLNAFKKINTHASEYDFVSAQKIWLQQDYPVVPKFTETMKSDYQSELKQADFVTAYENARLEINKWVEEKTKEKIKELIPVRGIDGSTRFVLVNAIYFKAKWLSVFAADKTQNEDFKVSATDSKKVEMMNKTFSGLKYYSSKDFTSIQLPYQGDDIYFEVFLPKDNGGEFKKDFVKKALKVKVMDYKSDIVNVKLPKFTTKYTEELSAVLDRIGLVLPFSTKANFSLMTPKALEDQIHIDKVFHQAFIEVGEKGAEAAAATAVAMVKMTAMMPITNPKKFFADRPFLYLIKKNDQVLFAGYYKGP